MYCLGFLYLNLYLFFFACVLYTNTKTGRCTSYLAVIPRPRAPWTFWCYQRGAAKICQKFTPQSAGKQQLSIGECSYANCRRAHFIVLPHTCCSCTFTTLPRISWFLLDISNFIHSSGVWGANYFEILALSNLTPQFCHSGGGFDDKKYVNGTHNKQQYYCNSPYFGGNVQKGGLLNEIGMIAPLSDLPIW